MFPMSHEQLQPLVFVSAGDFPLAFGCIFFFHRESWSEESSPTTSSPILIRLFGVLFVRRLGQPARLASAGEGEHETRDSNDSGLTGAGEQGRGGAGKPGVLSVSPLMRRTSCISRGMIVTRRACAAASWTSCITCQPRPYSCSISAAFTSNSLTR